MSIQGHWRYDKWWHRLFRIKTVYFDVWPEWAFRNKKWIKLKDK